MVVNLLAYTPNPEMIVSCAAKLCYSNSDIPTLMDNLTEEKIVGFIKQLESMGHESPLEHISFTFGIEGVSRILEQQLTRHRIASYSIQSGRYVKRNPTFYVPQEISICDEALSKYQEALNVCTNAYNEITDILKEKYVGEGMSEKTAEKKAIENARCVLANSLNTKIIFTMNARELLHFFSKRCCNRAQEEIRELADIMLSLVKEVAPNIFKCAGAPCVRGCCSEGKLSCGNPKERVI